MDYESEQSMEMEALEAILMDDLQPYVGTTPTPWTSHGTTYKVTINAEDVDEEEASAILELMFAHTPTYPDEPPCLRVRSAKGVSDAECQHVQSMLEEEVQNNLGMSMIFNLVSMAREWLQTREDLSLVPEDDPDVARKKAEEAEEAKRAAARAHGHLVTKETFEAWKIKFEAEQAAERAKGDNKEAEKKNRLTGKQFFMQASTAEVASEYGAMSDDDEVEFEEAAFEEGEDDIDYEDDDVEEDMLDEYLSTKK
jgi:hypothetical protein